MPKSTKERKPYVVVWRTTGNGNILHACEIDPCLKRFVTVCNMVVTGKPGNWTRLCKTYEKILAGVGGVD